VTEEHRAVPVSPRHYVMLAPDYLTMVDKAPQRDFVVRTLAKRSAGNMTLMTADLVIAGVETRSQFPLANQYPLHFRKTYYPGRLNGDPEYEFKRHTLASQITDRLPPPIGATPNVFRSCLLPGTPYNRLSKLGVDPEDANVRIAQGLPLESMAGLWRLAEEAYDLLTLLQRAGFTHGDAELHNYIVCHAPLEILLVDFESALLKDEVPPEKWAARCAADLEPLLRHAIFLQCALGRQSSPLAVHALAEMDRLFKKPDRFRRQIEEQGQVNG
jgi:hypothetical protein